jgi:hypothetical protein
MKKRLSYFLIFLFCCAWSLDVSAAISMSASSNKIPRGQQSMVTVSYRLSARDVVGPVTSAQGFFRIGGTTSVITLGTVNSPVMVTLTGGRGSATEAITIPVGVVENVLARGLTQFYYERLFTPGGASQRVYFQIVTDAAADLTLKSVSVYFENGRPEVTIERGLKGLKAFAEISYSGTGLFEGYWEVDGRILSRVVQQLSFGGLYKLQTPDVPELPTFDPGSHRLRFVVTRPGPGLPSPYLIYFVDLNVFKPAYMAIGLGSPADKALLKYGPGRFDWQRPEGGSIFLVQFGEKLGEKALFSAYTRDVSYVIPEKVITETFKSGRQYYWKVIAFDDENSIVGESTAQSFTFTSK